MINRLPDELIGLVASNLSQADCYHLVLTNRSIYRASLWRLYDSVVMDSTNQIYHKELVDFNDVVDYKDKKYKSTVIKTCNGLKQFFKTLQRNEPLLHLINYIKVIKLPDHFIELELAKNFEYLFAKVDNLKGCDFQYNTCFINLNKLLPLLQHQERLVELIGDFTTSMSMKKKMTNGLTNLSDISHSLELQKLSLINIQSSCFLNDLKLPRTLIKLTICKKLPSTFPVNYNLVNSIGVDFNYLQDCFNKYFYTVMTNEPRIELSSISNRNGHNTARALNFDTDLSTMKCLFEKNKHELYLKELKLDGICFDKDDDKVLINHINLSSLQKLTILDCNNTCDMLQKVLPLLWDLKELNINLNNCQNDFANLISPLKNLDKLYINIQDPENHCDCFQLLKNLNRHRNLTRLIIDFSSESHLKSIPIKLLERKLIKLSQLIKLRITISIKYLSRFIYNVLPYLSELQFLELVLEEFNVIDSNGISNSAFMTEEAIYDNDFDNFEFDMNELCPNLLTLTKIKVISNQILHVGRSLQYIKIFNVLITNDNVVKERGLEDWFTEKLL